MKHSEGATSGKADHFHTFSQVFRHLNKLHSNFCRDHLRQFLNGVISKKNFDLLISNDLDSSDLDSNDIDSNDLDSSDLKKR